jgi:hypothetical protein
VALSVKEAYAVNMIKEEQDLSQDEAKEETNEV